MTIDSCWFIYLFWKIDHLSPLAKIPQTPWTFVPEMPQKPGHPKPQNFGLMTSKSPCFCLTRADNINLRHIHVTYVSFLNKMDFSKCQGVCINHVDEWGGGGFLKSSFYLCKSALWRWVGQNCIFYLIWQLIKIMKNFHITTTKLDKLYLRRLLLYYDYVLPSRGKELIHIFAHAFVWQTGMFIVA